MSKLSTDELLHLSKLAALSFSEAELRDFGADLESVLGYVELLESAPTEGVEPTSLPIPFPTPLRDDEPAPPLPAELAVANAPDRSGTAFAVPKVIDEG